MQSAKTARRANLPGKSVRHDRPMMLAGVPIPESNVPWLVQLLRDAGIAETADRLDRALELGAVIVGLEVEDREAILRVLDSPPDAFAVLRGVLLQEHVWRRENGL